MGVRVPPPGQRAASLRSGSFYLCRYTLRNLYSVAARYFELPNMYPNSWRILMASTFRYLSQKESKKVNHSGIRRSSKPTLHLWSRDFRFLTSGSIVLQLNILSKSFLPFKYKRTTWQADQYQEFSLPQKLIPFCRLYYNTSIWAFGS